jgi:predicted NBD/HSP70 family sugar kinase
MNTVMGNYRRVLGHLQREGPGDKSTIAASLDLSLMTVNKIVNRFSELNIIVRCGKHAGASGRRSDLFAVNPDLFTAMGIDIDESRIVICAVNAAGNSFAWKEYRYDTFQERPVSGEAIIKAVAKYHSLFLEDLSLDPEKISVVGIAPHGIIDTENGRCVLGTHLGGLIDLDLRGELEPLFHVPVFVDDPARSLAYYEKKYGHGKGIDDFIYLFIGRGVGSGIVIDGKLHLGAQGMAGEIGHLIVKENGERCKCGNYGCLETVASVGNIIRQVKRGIEDGVMTKILDYCGGKAEEIDLHVLKKAADYNDKFALNVLDAIGSNLGKAVSVLVNLFNTELILIGGEGAVLGEHLLQPALRVMQNNSLNLMGEGAVLKIADYDSCRAGLSIAVEAFDDLFCEASRTLPEKSGKQGSRKGAFLEKIMKYIAEFETVE